MLGQFLLYRSAIHTHFFFFFFLQLFLRHMEVPRLGGESELQLLAYTTARAMPGLNCICNLCHNLWQCWILNPLSEARDWSASSWRLYWVLNPLSHIGNSYILFSYSFPLWSIIGDWIWFPVLYGRTLWFIYFLFSNLYLIILNPNLSLFHPLSPLVTISCLLCLWIFFINKFICVIFYVPHISDIIWYLFFSFWLTSLSMIISNCIYIAADGIISFLLWLSSFPLCLCTTSSWSIHLLMGI